MYLYLLSQFPCIFSSCNKWIWLHHLNRCSFKLVWHKWLFCHWDFTAIVFRMWGLLVISLLNLILSFPLLPIMILNLHVLSIKTEVIYLKSQQLPPCRTRAWPQASRQHPSAIPGEWMSSKMSVVWRVSLEAQISFSWVLPMENLVCTDVRLNSA